MTIARTPSLAHWGAFNALVENGRVIGCEPFVRDPVPSAMLAAIPEMVHSPLRIARPAIREGWREGRPRTGADRFREVSWDEALDLVAGELTRVRGNYGDTAIFGGSYGWSSAGRLHHARTLVRRFLFLGGGCVDQVGNYSWGAAQFLLPHVIGTYQPVTGRVTDWHSIVKHTQLVIAFGGLRAQEQPSDLRRHRRARAGNVARPGQRGRHRIRGDQPQSLGCTRVSRCPVDCDSSEHRHGADAGARAYAAGRTAARRRISRSLLHRLRDVSPLSAGRATTQRPRMPNGPRRSAASLRTAFAISRAAPPTPAASSPAHGRCSARIAANSPTGWRSHSPRCSAASACRVADSPSATARSAASACRASTCRVRKYRRRPIRPAAPFRSRASPTCCSSPALTSSTAVATSIRTSSWSTGPAAIRFIIIRTSTACATPGRGRRPSSSTKAGGRRRRVMPTSCCRRRRRWNATTSADRRATLTSSPCTTRSSRSATRNDFEIFRELAGRLGYEQAFTEGRDEMAWCRWIYERVRTGAAKKASSCRFSTPSGLTAMSSCRRPRGFRPVRGFPPRPAASPAQDAVRPDRDRIGNDRRLRL